MAIAHTTTAGIANSGVNFERAGTVTVSNSTFIKNQCDGNAIIANDVFANLPGGTLTLHNTIVASSPSVGGCSGAITDGGHNVDSGPSCRFSPANGSLSSTDPQLDPAGLQDNGGPTQTVALCTAVGVPAGCTAASPAIDAGDQSVCTAAPVNILDQRAFVRPGTGHSHCSIGAYEAGATAPVTCVGDCSGDGTVTIDELLTLVNIDLGNAEASTCARGVPSGVDVNVAVIIQAVNNALNGCP